jgi:hypothetical protein
VQTISAPGGSSLPTTVHTHGLRYGKFKQTNKGAPVNHELVFGTGQTF